MLLFFGLLFVVVVLFYCWFVVFLLVFSLFCRVGVLLLLLYFVCVSLFWGFLGGGVCEGFYNFYIIAATRYRKHYRFLHSICIVHLDEPIVAMCAAVPQSRALLDSQSISGDISTDIQERCMAFLTARSVWCKT